MKTYSFKQLMDFVNRADSHEKVETARAYIRNLNYISNEQYDELMDALAYISRELYAIERGESIITTLAREKHKRKIV